MSGQQEEDRTETAQPWTIGGRKGKKSINQTKKRISSLRKKLLRNEAIIINAPRDGATYADVIRKAKEAVPNLDELGIKVLGARKTATGDVLLEVGNKEEAELFALKLEETLGSKMTVRRPSRMTPVLILGLDESTTLEDLKEELVKRDPELANIKPFTIHTGAYGWGTAMIKTSIASALRLVADPKIRVKWNNCKIKLLEERKRICYKCLETGHLAAIC